MRYALNLGEDGRVLSVTYEEYATEEMPVVDSIPADDVSNYLYIDGVFNYDPLPKPEQPATVDDVLNALLGVTV